MYENSFGDYDDDAGGYGKLNFNNYKYRLHFLTNTRYTMNTLMEKSFGGI